MPVVAPVPRLLWRAVGASVPQNDRLCEFGDRVEGACSAPPKTGYFFVLPARKAIFGLQGRKRPQPRGKAASGKAGWYLDTPACACGGCGYKTGNVADLQFPSLRTWVRVATQRNFCSSGTYMDAGSRARARCTLLPRRVPQLVRGTPVPAPVRVAPRPEGRRGSRAAEERFKDGWHGPWAAIKARCKRTPVKGARPGSSNVRVHFFNRSSSFTRRILAASLSSATSRPSLSTQRMPPEF